MSGNMLLYMRFKKLVTVCVGKWLERLTVVGMGKPPKKPIGGADCAADFFFPAPLPDISSEHCVFGFGGPKANGSGSVLELHLASLTFFAQNLHLPSRLIWNKRKYVVFDISSRIP
jgi:hypothetical protein